MLLGCYYVSRMPVNAVGMFLDIHWNISGKLLECFWNFIRMLLEC